MQCGSCGKTTTGSGAYCSECGQPHSGERRRDAGAPRERTRHVRGGPVQGKPGRWCPKCDESRSPGVEFCNRCGSRLETVRDAGTTVSAPPRHSRADLEVLGPDGKTEVFAVHRDVIAGRGEGCGLPLLRDPHVSPRHARFYYERGSNHLCVEDLDSLNGVYLRVRGKRMLWDRDRIRIGDHIFRLEKVERTAEERREMTKIQENTDGTLVLGTSGSAITARLIIRLDTGEKGKEYSIGDRPILIGRGGGTHNFMSDAHISKAHAKIRMHPDGSFEIEDLNSGTGTWVQVRGGACRLDDQAELLIGKHRLRIRYV